MKQLRDVGFGRLRVPESLGGMGLSIPQLCRLLIHLGEVDANFPHIFLMHFGFVELCLAGLNDARYEKWLTLVSNNSIFGSAIAERSNTNDFMVVVERKDDAWVLNIAEALETSWKAVQDGSTDLSIYALSDIKTYQGQQIVTEQILEATNLLFEAGDITATFECRHLDRHWRNARTISSHNPSISRAAIIGDYYLNGVLPTAKWREEPKLDAVF